MVKFGGFRGIFVIVFFLVGQCVGFGQVGNPPPCTAVKQVDIAPDSVKRKVLFDFIKKAQRDKTFSSDYDKGIVHLCEYRNSLNNLCWALWARIDDYYKNNPPSRFADFMGDIVLVFDGSSIGHPIRQTGDIQALNQCLEQIIGDRVFSRPTTRSRWTSGVLPYINKPRNEGNRRIATGGGGGIYVEFKKDNTVSIEPMS